MDKDLKEIEQNKKAWGLIAKDHYQTFLTLLQSNKSLLNKIIVEELGDISGKTILHLQCNTGADSISLARMGAKKVVGVDLAPENIFYAKKLSKELDISNIDFIESDIMKLTEKRLGKFDIVFTSEGAIGWLPDLKKWGETIRYFLNKNGFFYAFDSHPIELVFDEAKFQNNELRIKYPYFKKEADEDDAIGGYASESKNAKNYFWMYTVSDIINSLIKAGLSIEFFNEYDKLFFDLGNMDKIDKGLFEYPYFKGKLPFSFSIKATLRI